MSPPDTAGRSSRAGDLLLAQDLRFTASTQGGLLYRPSTGVVVRVGLVEWEVLRRFDGSGGVEHVRERVERECGLNFTTTDLGAFARSATAAGLLEQPRSSIVRASRRTGLSWSVALWNPERFLAWSAQRTSLLFHPLATAVGLLLIAIGAVSFMERPAVSTASPVPAWEHVVMFLILLNLVSIVHECGHGLALHRYGASVREIGVRFVLGWPCWYCDITESYLLPRLRQRIAVILAGPFVQAVSCAVIVLAARGTGSHVLALRSTAALLGVLSVLNFFPLVRSDGYYLLTELAGMPNLRSDAWNWLASSPARQQMRTRLPAVRRLAVAVYALASAAFMALVLARAVSALRRVFLGAGHFSIRTVTAALSVVMILTMFVKRRSVSR